MKKSKTARTRRKYINIQSVNIISNKLQIQLINIQGLTKVKQIEIEKLIEGRNTIRCLTETQKKDEGIFFENKVTVNHSNRNKEDKKEGGLMLVYR